MRRIATAALSVLLALSMLLMVGGTASASQSPPGSGMNIANALAGGSSSYGTLSAIFSNDGTESWAPGVVGLLVSMPDKVTCNVATSNAAYASGWFSSTVYATVSATVASGQNGFFVYNFTTTAANNDANSNTMSTFNGDTFKASLLAPTDLSPGGSHSTVAPVLTTTTQSGTTGPSFMSYYQINPTLMTTAPTISSGLGLSPGAVFTNAKVWKSTDATSTVTNNTFTDKFATMSGSTYTATPTNTTAALDANGNALTSRALAPPAVLADQVIFDSMSSSNDVTPAPAPMMNNSCNIAGLADMNTFSSAISPPITFAVTLTAVDTTLVFDPAVTITE